MYKIMSPFLNYAICGLRPKTRGHNTQGWAGLLFSGQGLGSGCPDLLLGQFRAPMLTEFGPFFTNFSCSQKCNFFLLSQAGLGNPKSGLNRIRPLKTNDPWAKYWVQLRPDPAVIIKIRLIHTTTGISSFICHSKFKCILASRKLHKIRIV